MSKTDDFIRKHGFEPIHPDDTIELGCKYCSKQCCYNYNNTMLIRDLMVIANKMGVSTTDIIRDYCTVDYDNQVSKLLIAQQKNKACSALKFDEDKLKYVCVFEEHGCKPLLCTLNPVGRLIKTSTDIGDDLIEMVHEYISTVDNMQTIDDIGSGLKETDDFEDKIRDYFEDLCDNIDDNVKEDYVLNKCIYKGEKTDTVDVSEITDRITEEMSEETNLLYELANIIINYIMTLFDMTKTITAIALACTAYHFTGSESREELVKVMTKDFIVTLISNIYDVDQEYIDKAFTEDGIRGYIMNQLSRSLVICVLINQFCMSNVHEVLRLKQDGFEINEEMTKYGLKVIEEITSSVTE